MSRLLASLTLFALTILVTHSASAAELKALIVDGQNNHGHWPKTTAMMKQSLEQTGLFEVDVERTKYTFRGDQFLPEYDLPGFETEGTKKAKTDPDFHPNFSDYDVVISNFGWGAAPWPEQTRKDFVEYMNNGGGLVVVHAADNSFETWPEFNEMIGLGGWGGRNEKSGPYVYFNENGEEIRDTSPGRGGSHGPQRPFTVVARDRAHPIMKGLPVEWMHTKDELYQQLRGPALQMNVLATSFADPSKGGTGRHEPTAMTIKFGEGRVFHTPLGHADYSFACVGLQTLINRGTEWAATGEVTQAVPENFPNEEETSTWEFIREPVTAAN